jgi:dephospho-CoA kinase
MEKKSVIGLLGTIGSGKGTAAKFLKKKYGFRIITMGNILRALARKLELPSNRKSLQLLQKKYRAKYGGDYFIRMVWQKINDSKQRKWVIDGIRTPEDTSVSRKNGAKLILVDAKPMLRFERMKKRRRKGFSKTFAEFQQEEKREWKLLNFKKSLKYVQYKLDNSKGPREFLDKINKLVKRLI